MAGALAYLFADSRLPIGGHAHSGGVEEAIERGFVSDEESLASYLSGRLQTSGLLFGATAALVCERCQENLPPAALRAFWEELDQELDARTPSPTQRATSRQQGAHVVRLGVSLRAGPPIDSLAQWSGARPPHHPVALGALHGAFAIGPSDVATSALYHQAAGPASAAVRFLGLDPTAVTGVLVGLSDLVDDLAVRALAAARQGVRALPNAGAPQADYLAEAHGQRRERLFAS